MIDIKKERKNKVILFFFTDGKKRDTLPHVGLMSIAAYVKKHFRYKVQIICIDNYVDIKEVVKKYIDEAVIICGLSVLTPYIAKAVKLSAILKDTNKNIPIVWGGIHPTLLPIQCFECNDVDFVITGDGEISLLELIKFLLKEGKTNLCDMPGLFYRNKNSGEIIASNCKNEFFISSGELAYESVEDLEDYISGAGMGLYLKKYTKFGYIQKLLYLLPIIRKYYKHRGGRHLPVLTGRGCPMRCTFCINNAYFRKPVKYDIDKILSTILKLKEKFKIEYFMFVDELFLINKNFAIAFAECIIQESINIKWTATGHANIYSKMKHSELEVLKKAGLIFSAFGAESGSEKILKRLKKGINTAQIIKSARLLSECDVPFCATFFCGFPGDGIDDYMETLHLMSEIRKNDVNNRCWIQNVQVYRPYPGNELYDEAVKAGYILPTLFDWDNVMTSKVTFIPDNMPWIDDKKFNDIQNYVRYVKNNFLGYRINPIIIRMLQRLKHVFYYWFNASYRKLDIALRLKYNSIALHDNAR